jgi:hypothetical protein
MVRGNAACSVGNTAPLVDPCGNWARAGIEAFGRAIIGVCTASASCTVAELARCTVYPRPLVIANTAVTSIVLPLLQMLCYPDPNSAPKLFSCQSALFETGRSVIALCLSLATYSVLADAGPLVTTPIYLQLLCSVTIAYVIARLAYAVLAAIVNEARG